MKWIAEYLIPTFLLFCFSSRWENINIYSYVLITLIIYCLYEIGYIINDAITTKHENKPTIRLNIEEQLFFDKNNKQIIGTRLALATISSVILYFINDNHYSVFRTLILIWSILLIFILYNRIRGHMSFILHFLLLMMRYFSACLLPLSSDLLAILILTFLIFPLPNILENISRGKFNISYNFTRFYLNKYENRYLFRIWYYSILVVAYGIYFFISDTQILLIVLPLYFFVYQCVFYLANSKRLKV